MKKLVKLLGIIAFVAVIGISMSACVVGLPPGVPTGVGAYATSSSSIYIYWNAVTDATYYNVYYSTSPYSGYLLDGTSYSTSYTSSYLSSGTTYYFKVSAQNSFGEGSTSDYVYATTNSSSTYGTGTVRLYNDCSSISEDSNTMALFNNSGSQIGSSVYNVSRGSYAYWTNISRGAYYYVKVRDYLGNTYTSSSYWFYSSDSYLNFKYTGGTPTLR